MKIFSLFILLILNVTFINTQISYSSVDSSDDTENESDNPPTSLPEPEEDSKKIILIGFRNYRFDNKGKEISFESFFRRILGVFELQYLNVTLRVFKGELRNLKEADDVNTITCERCGDCKIDKKDIIFNCSYKTKVDKVYTVSVDKNFTFDKSYDNLYCNLSGYAERTINNITTEYKNQNFYVLENSTLIKDETTFSVNGIIEKDGFDKKEIILLSKNKINKNEIEIPCSVTNSSKNYTLNCIPNQKFKGNIDNASEKASSKSSSILTVSMFRNETIEVNPIKVSNKSKSSSGLSAGAIAGITIGCVITLLAVAIIIYLCKKESPKAPMQNNNANAISMYSSNTNENATDTQ